MKILDDIKAELPKTAMISEIAFEGSEIILYTKNKEFFKTSLPLIKKIVSTVKKRIEVRSDPSIVLGEEKTEEIIKEAVPKEAGIKDIYFEPEFSKVVIHAEKPGLVIGKSGETLQKIKEKTFWTPDIRRAPAIDSEIIRSIRKMLHRESAYRKKFLHKLGEKIYTPGKDVELIRISCLGGCREVGRSCFLLQTPQSKVLLDCGLSVSATASRPFPYLDAPEFNIQQLDAVIVSHAHLDHCGLIPYLYEFGYQGPCYGTRPNRDLMTLLQLDYIGICQRENKKPPYTSRGIEEMLKHCVPLEYGEVSDITPDMRVTLQNAGHLMGSAVTHIHIGDGLFNILYSGDMKYENTKILEKAHTDFARVEALILEATYGSQEDIQPPHREGEQQLMDAITKTIERGGKVLIPTFAVGRAQDVIATLADSNIDVPIYLDGMLWDSTAIHTAYPEFMHPHIQNKILHKGKNPFIDPRMKGIGSQKEREQVHLTDKPCVVLATSGMLSGGPAIDYLQKFSGNEKNTLLFVGYQAEGTMGRRIQKGWKRVQLDNGRDIEIKMEIVTIQGLSGHSDYKQLIDYVKNMRAMPKKIITNHGESSKCIELARNLHKIFRIETEAPKILDVIRLR